MEEDNFSQLATIRLHGDYDITRREELAELFRSLSGQEPLVIDMSGVNYVDSTFLNELASLRLGDKTRPITLSGVTKHILRLLKTVNFDKLFVIRGEA